MLVFGGVISILSICSWNFRSYSIQVMSNNSSCFRWIKTMWPWKKRWISRFQTTCSRYPIPILMNIKSIQILGELSSELQDFLHVPKPISPSDRRIRWTRDCSGGSVCGALWPLSLGGEAGRWPKKHGECIWGFPKIVVPNNHGFSY